MLLTRTLLRWGLAVNEGKTKYMVSTSRDLWRIDSQITPITILLMQSMNLFILATPLPAKMMSVKRRITSGNTCYRSLNGQLSNRDLSRTTKLILYRTVILHTLRYGAEEWTLLSTDAVALRAFERKLLCKIFAAVRVADEYRIWCNSELYELLNNMDFVQRINIQRLC